MTDINSIVAQTLSNITCGMRFDGQLNIDLNEITNNLVPFPNQHFLISSLSPIQTHRKLLDIRNHNQLFEDLMSPTNCLIDQDLRKYTQLAMSLMIRGDLSLSETEYYAQNIRKKVKCN